MTFQVGDAVIHPVHGVGHIVGIIEKRLVEDRSRLYYEIATEKSTIWMPIELSATIGLRRVVAKRELARYRAMLKSRAAPLNDNHSKRQAEIALRRKTGSLKILCEVVRDLTARSARKRLTQLDNDTLRKARAELEREWAAAAGISVVDAGAEIDALLNDKRRA